MKTKILEDFQICISVPLKPANLSYVIMFSQRTFFSIVNLLKRESYLFYYNAIFKDHVLINTQSSTEMASL